MTSGEDRKGSKDEADRGRTTYRLAWRGLIQSQKGKYALDLGLEKRALFYSKGAKRDGGERRHQSAGHKTGEDKPRREAARGEEKR